MLQCCIQDMEHQSQSAVSEEEVIYYVNRDSAGWVEQHVQRRVYIELKLECTRNRSREVHKSRDDWLCLYCAGTFPSKLRLTDHRVGGCPRGPLDSKGSRWELPVYPNLKTAKQGKDLKLALERGDGSIWDNLSDNSVWLDLNPELKDVVYPPSGAKVQVRRFMEPSLGSLTACPAVRTECTSQPKVRQPIHRNQHTAPPTSPAYVDLPDDEDDENDDAPPQSKKRSHAQMAEEHRAFHSSRRFRDVHGRRNPQNAPKSARGAPVPNVGCNGLSHPIRVTPLQSRQPSPDKVVTPDAPPDASTDDAALALRKDRHAFYMRAASAARVSVRMDTPKPALRSSIQPPGLFYLVACGLLNFDFERGDLQTFEAEVQKWSDDPAFMDRLFAAYGRFHSASHQVQT